MVSGFHRIGHSDTSIDDERKPARADKSFYQLDVSMRVYEITCLFFLHVNRKKASCNGRPPRLDREKAKHTLICAEEYKRVR